MTEKCDDYDGYKKYHGPPGFTRKGMRKIWPEDAKMEEQLKCLDRAHSKAKCIRPEDFENLVAFFDEYTSSKREPMCPHFETDVIACVKTEKSIYPCHKELQSFKQCVDQSVYDIYHKKRKKYEYNNDD